MENSYRKLSEKEISTLESQGCSADSWDNVAVVAEFSPGRVRRCTFSGNIKLGSLSEVYTNDGGIPFPASIQDVHLHNCTIGNEVYIRRVGKYIANYDIGDRVRIENTAVISVDQTSTFGNGTIVNAMNESGGRYIPIYDYLSSHVAYLMVIYRFQQELFASLKRKIDEYTSSVSSNRGTIGNETTIDNCGKLLNVRIGDSAQLDGVSRLINGTIHSKSMAPTKIGSGVAGNDFIVATDAIIDGGVRFSNCYVGQGVVLGKGFSAVHSLFFSNCVGYHGEACSVFAGPYVTTHHKSTLLIASYVSFLNAGSGSNQSNHLYKLGPVHQGAVDRGSKTGSGSYMLWPMKVGAFTIVLGRHIRHTDTSMFPFSYLIESQYESSLVPGVNLCSIGTIRDVDKWKHRDRRKDPEKQDYIIFELLSPYTVRRIQQGSEILKRLLSDEGRMTINHRHEGVTIQHANLEKGIEIYELGIQRYLGNVLVDRLLSSPFSTKEELQELLTVVETDGRGEWFDWAGLYLPKSRADFIINEVKANDSITLTEIARLLATEYEKYNGYEFTWVDECITKLRGKPLSEHSPSEINAIVVEWISAVERLDLMRWVAALKEFNSYARIGYGIDYDDNAEKDFQVVRGSGGRSMPVRELRMMLIKKKKSAADLSAKLVNL